VWECCTVTTLCNDDGNNPLVLFIYLLILTLITACFQFFSQLSFSIVGHIATMSSYAVPMSVVEGVSSDVASLLVVCLTIFLAIIGAGGRGEMTETEITETESNFTVIREIIQRNIPAESRSGDVVAASEVAHNPSCCPICIETTRFQVMTNCGHHFCAPCILTYWRHIRSWQVLKCPCCRQEINLLVTQFGRGDAEGEERQRIMIEIQRYNDLFGGGSSSLWQRIRDMPVLLREMWSELWSGDGGELLFRGRLVFSFFIGFLYLLTPLDVIPEGVMGVLGYIDDAVFIFLILFYVVTIYRELVRARQNPTP
jgi:RING finger protein 170